uniref:V-set and immunoglobulin domain-containing protein 1-like n=1 Tax=Myxine glutinosa TaxID=7769 RepID=UPI00358ECA2D
MSLSLHLNHSLRRFPTMWTVFLFAALITGSFAQHKEKACQTSRKYTLCVLGEVLGTVGGEATLPCNFTFPETNTEITRMGWIKHNFHGSSFIDKWRNGTVTNTRTIKHHKHLDIVGDVSTGKVSLKMGNLNLGDDGTYYCAFWFNIFGAKNDVFRSFPGTRLVVGVKPKISFVNQSINGTIELTCKGSGIPLPNLDLLDTNGTKLNTSKKKDSKEIQLQMILPEFSPGKFTCVGRNIHGEARVEITLELKDEPRSLTLGLIIGIVVLSLLLVTALAAVIYCGRRKIPGKGKGREDKSSSTTCDLSTSSPTTLELPGQEPDYENVCGASAGQETDYENLCGTSSGQEPDYENVCGASAGQETDYENVCGTSSGQETDYENVCGTINRL